MPTPTFKGSLAPIFKTEKVSFDPLRGLSVTREYESGGLNLNGFANELMRDGIPFDLTKSGVRSTLQTKTAGAVGQYEEIAIDQWQLLGNEVQSSLFDHPGLKIAVPFPEVWAMMAQYAPQIDGEDELIQKMDEFGLTDPQFFAALDWFLLYSRGVTHYAHGQYVLRHTVTVPGNPYSLRAASAINAFVSGGIESIYTTSQLLSECDATSVTYGMPATMRTAIQSIPFEFASGYTWGWRKLPVTQTSAANARVDISSEYWLGLWNTFLVYGSA